MDIIKIYILDFKLSPCFECRVLSSGLFPGVCSLTLSLLMSYIYGAPCKSRNFNVVYIYMYEPTFGNAESRLFLFAAQCFNIESMQKVFLWHSCV
jgi:hypothetical protein